MGNRINMELVLASASPRRRELLHQVGLSPVIEPSHVDELILSTAPDEAVKELSLQKARDVAFHYEGTDAVILGADTVVSVDHEILGKPRNTEEAFSMLKELQGRTHQVYTGVTLIFAESGETLTFSEKTEVQVYPMTEQQIRRYIATGEPMDKAGAYGIQGFFAAYVSGIEGDYNNVVGLPVARICRILSERGLY